MTDDVAGPLDEKMENRRRQLAREKFVRQAATRQSQQKYRARAQSFGVFGFISGILGAALSLKTTNTSALEFNPAIAWVMLSCLGAAVTTFAIMWFHERRKYMKNQNDTFEQSLADEREYHAQAMEKLRQASELTTLMQLNQDQIKTYHDIVTEQADKSFKSSRVAMGVGMLLLVCAAVGGAWVPLEQVRWFIGALAAFSTLLSGYLSRTYLALYKESIGQLNRYFDQPVLNSYYLAAERLIGKLGEEHQDEVRKQVISEILTNSYRRGSAPTQSAETKPKSRSKKRAPKQQGSSINGTPQA